VSAYKSEVRMMGVSIPPIYRRRKWTVINTAKREIRNAQKIHFSYNVSAKIIVYEKDQSNNWAKIEEIIIDPQ
jgi:hypothetical protein